jgi:hypothetical protein
MIKSSSEAPHLPQSDLPCNFLLGILFFVPHLRQRMITFSVIVVSLCLHYLCFGEKSKSNGNVHQKGIQDPNHFTRGHFGQQSAFLVRVSMQRKIGILRLQD